MNIGRNHRFRERTLFFFLGLVLIFPIVATRFTDSPSVNRISALLLLLIPLLYIKDLRTILSHAYNTYRYTIIACLFLFIAFWQIQHGVAWLNSQFLLYASIAITFPVLIYIFSTTGEKGFRYVFLIKSSAITLISIIFLLSIIETSSIGSTLPDPFFFPPVYRNIRHFNYELFIVVSLTFYFSQLKTTPLIRIIWLLVFTMYGYLMFWSAARSMALALSIYIILLFISRTLPWKSIVFGMSGLTLGAMVFLLSGNTDRLSHQLEKSITNLDELTSGRLSIWHDSILFLSKNSLSVLFGNGPDAFRLLVREHIETWVIQPHNLFIQIILEFGFIGVLISLLGFYFLSKKVIITIRSQSSCALRKCIAITLCATFVYAIFDGILYHAIPLVFIVFLSAFLYASPAKDKIT